MYIMEYLINILIVIQIVITILKIIKYKIIKVW
jgi:hypothetical protein